MRTLIALFLVSSLVAPASAARIAGPRSFAPRAALPFAAVRPGLASLGLASSLRLSVAPALGSSLSSALLARPVAAAAAARPAAVAAAASDPDEPGSPRAARAEGAPALPAAPGASVSLEAGAARLAQTGIDQAQISAQFFDGMSGMPVLPGGWSDSFEPALRAPDGSESRRLARAVSLMSRSRVASDIYAAGYYRLQNEIHVDDDPAAAYDARLAWRRDGTPYLSLTRDLLATGSDAAVAALLIREFSHLYYAGFPDSAERSWLAHSAMVQSFAEITASGSGHWRYDMDRLREGRYVIHAFYQSWGAAARRLADPREGEYFRWLKASSESRSGPNARYSLRELYQRRLLSWEQYQQMDAYFQQVLSHERGWLAHR